MPRQNTIDLRLTAEQTAQWENAVATLETLTALFPLVDPAEKRQWVRAPEGSEGWMADLHARATQNLKCLPRDLDLDYVQRDLDLAAWLGPQQLRVARVLERIETARFLSRSDAFADLLTARRAMRDAGVRSWTSVRLSHGAFLLADIATRIHGNIRFTCDLRTVWVPESVLPLVIGPLLS